jgi:hypothetical protein
LKCSACNTALLRLGGLIAMIGCYPLGRGQSHEMPTKETGFLGTTSDHQRYTIFLWPTTTKILTGRTPSCGASPFLTKPFSMEELQHAIALLN